MEGTSGTGIRVSSTQISRISVESISKYSAMPPQTPAILQSTAERISRRDARNGSADLAGCRAPQK
jgi:hypothetical protein